VVPQKLSKPLLSSLTDLQQLLPALWHLRRSLEDQVRVWETVHRQHAAVLQQLRENSETPEDQKTEAIKQLRFLERR
jgi:hypothetical protein